MKGNREIIQVIKPLSNKTIYRQNKKNNKKLENTGSIIYVQKQSN